MKKTCNEDVLNFFDLKLNGGRLVKAMTSL